MYITHLPNGGQLAASIEPVEDADFKKITKKRYFFDWNVEKSHSVYKLTLEGGSDILGLVSLHDFDNEQRIEIRLLAVSKENMGTGKNIEGIAGNLIVFAARRAVKKYGAMAAISLVPKTRLKTHYIDKFGFEPAGLSLFMEGNKLHRLLKEYKYDKT